MFETDQHVTSFAADQYQVNSGGLTLLPYSSEDLELSARVADLNVEGFDNIALKQYFFNILENRNSNQEEITLALYGLSSLGEPVLPRLQAWVTQDDLTVSEQLYSALALNALGDTQRARDIYVDILSQYGEIKEPHIIIRASKNSDEILKNTALTATLAAYLNEPEQYGMWDYLRFHRPNDILLYLEELNFVQANKLHLSEVPKEIAYSVDGDQETVTLSRPKFTHQVTLASGERLGVESAESDISATSNVPVALSQSDFEPDSDIGISREYYVNGRQTNTFSENDLIEVRLDLKFERDALDGNYQITDNLPAGLIPVSRLRRFGTGYDCRFWYPHDRDGQTVKFIVNKNFYRRDCGGTSIRYYARVKTKGSYRAEPAVIQSTLNPDFLNLSDETRVTIE